MIELLGFDSSELRLEFVDNKIISLRTIRVTENEWVTQVDGVWLEIRHREDRSDRLLRSLVNLFTEEDSRFIEIGNLTRGLTEFVKDIVDLSSFIKRGLTTDNKIISE